MGDGLVQGSEAAYRGAMKPSGGLLPVRANPRILVPARENRQNTAVKTTPVHSVHVVKTTPVHSVHVVRTTPVHSVHVVQWV